MDFLRLSPGSAHPAVLSALPELFDYFIRCGHNGQWKLEAQQVGRFHIDDELKTAGLFDRQIGGLSAFKNFIDINRGSPTNIEYICEII